MIAVGLELTGTSIKVAVVEGSKAKPKPFVPPRKKKKGKAAAKPAAGAESGS